jgi:hypothetical protein
VLRRNEQILTARVRKNRLRFHNHIAKLYSIARVHQIGGKILLRFEGDYFAAFAPRRQPIDKTTLVRANVAKDFVRSGMRLDEVERDPLIAVARLQCSYSKPETLGC